MTQEIVQVIGDGKQAVQPSQLGLRDRDLLRMHAIMVLVRAFDAKMLTVQRQGRIGFYVAGRGQEAHQVGAAYALQPEDWMFPHYRDPGAALVRGASLGQMVHQCFGTEQDLVKGRQMPVHYSFRGQNFVSIGSPLSTRIVHAVGCAHAMKHLGHKTIVLTTFGEGASSEGDFHVALNGAGVYRVPVVFVLENNQWAISVPASRQTATKTFAQKGQAYGFGGIRVDGNDVLAVYKVVKQAVGKARAGGGPTLVEAYTFRMSSHSSSDDSSRYCPPELLDEGSRRDPIDRFERCLASLGVLDTTRAAEVRRRASENVDAAVALAEPVGPPGADSMFEDVYAEAPPGLERQRDQLRHERRSL